MIFKKINSIFVHIPRTGGTSISTALRKYSDQEVKVLPEGLMIVPGGKHKNSTELAKTIDNFDKYFKFCFVRNPWDRFVSFYTWYRTSNDFKKLNEVRHKMYRNMNFEEFIIHITKRAKLQSDFILDKKDNIIVDFIGRYEDLNDDFSKLCSMLNIEEKLPVMNSSKHKNYKKYYNKKTKDMVYKAVKKDIELFGYKF
jgi:hypothetical protein